MHNDDPRVIVKEVYAKNILSKSKVMDYTINPYIGCEHACTYCYARFIKRFTRHKEEWGKFVDVKINSADLLQIEVRKKKVGKVWISGVCDPYQPLEQKYELTKRCLEILSEKDWPVIIQTKSSLVMRDLGLLKNFKKIEVGLTITTADENIRKIFEINSPSIRKRIETLQKLSSIGVPTFAMIAPLLPKVEGLATKLRGKVDYVLIDRMNYHYADQIYKRYNLENAMTDFFFAQTKKKLANAFANNGIPYKILF